TSIHHRLWLLAFPMQTRSLPCVWPDVGSPGSRATSFHTMPGSSTTPGPPSARACAPVCIAFRLRNGVSTRDMNLCRAQWLAYVLLCRRFAAAFAGDRARLGVDVDRYSFIVSDLHRLLIAGLPAHCERICMSSGNPGDEDCGPHRCRKWPKN